MSIFRHSEPVVFLTLTLTIQGTSVITTEYELKRNDIGMNAALYIGNWNFNEDTERSDCLKKLNECSRESYEQFNSLLNDLKVIKWNDKHLNNPHALDGETFTLDIQLTNGSSIHCSGTNSYPKGYSDLYKAIKGFF